jgi:hypothetical protein
MSTPTVNDPWASTDHDPIHAPQPASATPPITTAHALLLARADLADAVAHTGATRHAYANSSAQFAAAVFQAGDATDAQRELATYYLADAEILAHL